MCILDHTRSTFFCLGKILKKLADDQWSFKNKRTIYYIKHTCIQPFSMEVGWPEIPMVKRSIYYVLYLHILHFNFVRQHSISLEFQDTGLNVIVDDDKAATWAMNVIPEKHKRWVDYNNYTLIANKSFTIY